jgi:DNA-binding GntR family transcriptional regulator
MTARDHLRTADRKTGEPSAPPSTDRRRPRQSFTEQAYREIRRQILDNEMPAGFQITEQDLALRLRMSRTPTREALVHLAGEGLIEIWPRHGMRVRHISIDDLIEIYQILTALESLAAGLAAKREVEPQTIKALRASIAAMDKALNDDDMKGWARADDMFHRLLAEASGNRRLAEAVVTYQGQTHRMRMMTLRMRPKPTTSNRDHEDVVDAIENRDPQTARSIHHRHRERSGEMLIALLEAHGITSL